MAADTHGKAKILIVDDEKLIRLTLSAKLKKVGYYTVAVDGVESAVAEFKRNPDSFSAVITDIMMGDMDGFMFRDIIRGFDPTVPIFFLTALDPEEGGGFLKKILDDPISYYLPKAVPTNVLLKRIRQVVASHRVEMFIQNKMDEDRKSLDLAAKSLDSCREELRNCLWDLRNQTLEEASMDEAIRQTLKPHIGDANLTVRFSVPREKLSDNTTHSILHIIRELASNAVRHGNATEIKVAGAIENDRLLFSVSDNGCGFNPENRPTVADGHFGLQGIQDRVDAFEGEMTLQSAPGKGTKATISIRLKSSQMSPMSHSSQTSQRSQP